MIKIDNGALDQWRRRAEQESFNNSILREIREVKANLEWKIADLRVRGNHYEADKTEKLVTWLNLTEESMRKMLNNSHIEKKGVIK